MNNMPRPFTRPKYHALVLVLYALGTAVSHAEESVCARVKLEIKQEVTLERQAFDAQLKITNTLLDVPLESLDVNVRVTDEHGRDVETTSDPRANASFFIRIVSADGVRGGRIDGSGSVDPSLTAEIHWLIIPARGAALENLDGMRYFVGATMSYRLRGEFHEIGLAPDLIIVKPLPDLALDYFLHREVRADDPNTETSEMPEPFTLGIRIVSRGSGAAQRVRLDTAQPKIVENKQGLLIGFEILRGFVDDQPAAPSLLLDFATIAPGVSKVGRWVMETTLSGEFVDFSATITHADELGGELTSIIRTPRTHFLVHDVKIDLPARDNVRDFLARERIDAETEGPLTVRESEGLDTIVSDQSEVATLTVGPGSDVYLLSTPITAGFLYAKVADPTAGQQAILQVVRQSDGKVLSPENAWQQASGTGSNTTYSLNIFDANGGGSYLIQMGPIILGPKPPVIQFIEDRTTPEGSQVGFNVEASDPNGTIPALSIVELPVGATFEDQGDGLGVFQWLPQVGQAGTYPVTFRATDGTLTVSRSVTIHVLGEGPTPTPTPTPASSVTTPTITHPIPTPTAGLPRLSGEAAKRADKCQTEIKKASVKFVGNKLKRLAVCANAMLKCIETKPGNDKCLDKAAKTCAKEAAKVADDEELLLKTIETKCAALGSTDLRSAAGLGYDRLGIECEQRFGVTLSDVRSVASCVVSHHECVTERIFEAQNPRAAELLRLAGVSLGGDACLEDSGAAGDGVGNNTIGKAVHKCAVQVAKAGGGFATKRLKSLEKCVDAFFSCVQTKPGNVACIAKARDVCEKERERIDDQDVTLDGVLEKGCSALPFTTLRARNAASFLSLTSRCDALAVEDLVSLADYRMCLARATACATQELIRFAAPRTDELLNAFGESLDEEYCPTDEP